MALFGIYLADRWGGASLSPSYARDCMRRLRVQMKKFLRNLVVMAMLGVVSTGAFAQRKGDDKRPPKEPGKVVTPDKREPPPPPQNSNRPKPDDKKKPH